MTFFEQQAQAKRKTRTLLALFGATVLCIIIAVHSVLVLFVAGQGSDLSESATPLIDHLLDPKIFLLTASATLLIILSGSIYKIVQLRGGGARVATSLGGHLIPADSTEYQHRKLLNIVEEMAIASGIPVPPVYLIPELSINAFAAGFTIDDAVIGINQGTLNTLTRDELQGVVAHEFSHILNGDMQLNLRLMGLLQGLLVIALIGRFLLHASPRRHRYRHHNRDSKDGGGAIIALGAAFLAIGWLGVLGGRLIKAAVSRQREFLADASAVQFTRNPLGISGALQKIGGFALGSRVEHPRAEETSHLFFGNGLGTSWFALFATHPPLADRINRIDPSFDQKFTSYDESFLLSEDDESTTSGFAGGSSPTQEMSPVEPGHVVTESIGNPTFDHMQRAQQILAIIPLRLHQNIRSMAGAEAAILALLTSDKPEIMSKQREALESSRADDLVQLYDETLSFFHSQQSLTPQELSQVALPMVDIAIGALTTLPPDQRKSFLILTRQFVLADGEVTLFEYMLHKTFEKHFSSDWKEQNGSLDSTAFVDAAHKLLSVAVHLSSSDQQSSLFSAAFSRIDKTKAATPLNAAGKELEYMDQSLEQLKQSSSIQKEILLTALEEIILSDQHVSNTEAELYRAIAASLGCPVPPVLAVSST